MKKIILACILLNYSLLFAQNEPQCFVTNSNASTLIQQPISCGSILPGFIPSVNEPLTYVNLNFWFLKPTTGSGIWDNVNANDINALINQLDNVYANLTDPYIITTTPVNVIHDSRIRFVLKNFAVVPDNFYNNTNLMPPPQMLTYMTDVNAINIIINYNPGIGGGAAYDPIPSNGIYYGCAETPATLYSQFGLISHEIGHTLGLGHTNGYTSHDEFTTTDNLDSPSEYIGVGSCGLTPPQLFTNNIMGGNWACKSYLSPDQIGIIYYLLKKKNSITNACLTTPFLSSNCLVNHSNDIAITTNTTWDAAQLISGDVIVNEGAHLIVNCDVAMYTDAKVVIKRGGKLTINNTGKFFSAFNDFWEGIIVEGFNGAPQLIDYNGMPDNSQGMVEINGGTIKDAKIGVCLVEKDINGNPVDGTGGGILHAINAKIVANTIGVEFHPYAFSYIHQPTQSNISYFKNTRFNLSTEDYNGVETQFANVILNGVKNVQLLGCSFGNSQYGVQGINSSVIMKDYCTAENAGTCTGTLIRNSFASGSNYGIFLSNTASNLPSIIDHLNFPLAQTKRHIYMANNFGTQISNCNFNILNTTAPIKYGVYLDNCNGYKIENNSFVGLTTNAFNSVGIYVNNSGPYANSIYNNTFNKLQQGIWAQNQNVDVSNGTGLKLNCNDFTNCKYDVGVQKGGKYLPTTPNNTGIDNAQGVAGLPDETFNVRNTYATYNNVCGDENKFYVNTSNGFNTVHGSFLGAQFHPTPQPGCSDVVEVQDVVGLSPQNPIKSSYCPASYPPSFSSFQLNGTATAQRQLKKQHQTQLTTLVDGGNTQALLDAINSNMSDGNLKNLLAQKSPYLSDVVLMAFFNRVSPPYGLLVDIHGLNAPVSNAVWQAILSLNLPNGVMQNVTQQQFAANKLNARQLLQAKQNLANTELGLVLNEKLRRFMSDTTIAAPDSIKAIYALNEITNSAVWLTKYNIAIGDYVAASTTLNQLAKQKGAYDDFIALQQLIISIKQHPSDASNLINSDLYYSRLTKWAVSSDALTEGDAKALLLLAGLQYNEECLVPTSNGARLASEFEDENTETKSFKIYPNPANNQLTIEVGETETATLQLFDVTGKLLHQQSITQKAQINIDALQNGIYIVNLISQNGNTTTKKVAVIK